MCKWQLGYSFTPIYACNSRCQAFAGCITAAVKKPYRTSWITYTLRYDDFGMRFDNAKIEQARFEAYVHPRHLTDYDAGVQTDTPAVRVFFSAT